MKNLNCTASVLNIILEKKCTYPQWSLLQNMNRKQAYHPFLKYEFQQVTKGKQNVNWEWI